MGLDAAQHLGEVGSAEAPIEGSGGGVVARLKGQEPLGEGVPVSEVSGANDLALHNREDNLYLFD